MAPGESWTDEASEKGDGATMGDDMEACIHNPAPGRWRQEEKEIKASLGCMMVVTGL